MGATLRRFLARLSIDHTYLRDFIKEPGRILAEASLTESERAAMLSRDQSQIQLSLLEETTPARPYAPTQAGRSR